MLGEAIFDLTYQIIEGRYKIQYIITDNSSNMVKAFKSDVAASKPQNVDLTDEIKLEVEHKDEEEEEELEDDRDKEVADFDSQEARHENVFE